VLLIFVARVVDVSLGTLRIICITRGYRKLSVLFAFLEITICVYSITSVVRYLDRFANVAAYAAGFAAGNWVGMWIEQKLALEAIRQSGGLAGHASDKNMLHYSRILRDREGLSVLPASTAGLIAMLDRHRQQSFNNDRYVVVITGRKA